MTTGGFDPNADPQSDPYAQQPGYPPPPPTGYPPPPNPYGAPGGYPGQPPAAWGSQPGTLGLRWGARMIDGIAVLMLSWLLALFFDSGSRIMVTGLFTGLLMFVYFVVMEVTQGRTVGKMMLGLRVHGPGGASKPDVKQSAIRNLWTLLPIIPIVGGFLGFVAIAVIGLTIKDSPTKQGKHDELAGGTQVVKG